MPTALPARWLGLIPFLLMGCGSSERGEVVFPPGGLAIDSTGRQARSFTHDSLVLLRTVGGASDEDTTLVNPYLMASDADQVYLFEMDNRILCYDTLGKLRWVQGKEGSGPGEYRGPRDLKIGADGRLWVVDPPSGRITILNRTTGKVDTMMALGVGHTEAITPLRHRFAVYPPDGNPDIQYFTPTGISLEADSFPWSGYRQLDFLSRQFRTAVDRVTGHSVVGFTYGNGWFAFDTSGGAGPRRYYVEPTGFPPVIRQREGDKIKTSLVRTPGAAIDLQMRSDTVFVLFDGKDPGRHRKVDMYAWEGGAYYGSFLLPEGADNIGVTGSLVIAFATNPVPRLSYYRRLAAPRP